MGVCVSVFVCNSSATQATTHNRIEKTPTPRTRTRASVWQLMMIPPDFYRLSASISATQALSQIIGIICTLCEFDMLAVLRHLRRPSSGCFQNSAEPNTQRTQSYKRAPAHIHITTSQLGGKRVFKKTYKHA